MSLIFLLKWQFFARISFNERKLTFWHSFRVINMQSNVNIVRQGQKLQIKHQKNYLKKWPFLSLKNIGIFSKNVPFSYHRSRITVLIIVLVLVIAVWYVVVWAVITRRQDPLHRAICGICYGLSSYSPVLLSSNVSRNLKIPSEECDPYTHHLQTYF